MITLIIISTFILWVLATLCIPHLKDVKRPVWRVVLCKLAYLYDLIYNMTIGSLIFWELPEKIEPLTYRLKRLKDNPGWRGKEARAFCWLIERIPGGRGHCD